MSTTSDYITIPSPIPPWQRPQMSPLSQTITEAGTISLTEETTFLDSTTAADDEDATAAYAVVLPDGNYRGQPKTIMVPAANYATTALFRVTGTIVGFTSILFGTTGWTALLKWDGAGWHWLGGNATLE